MTVSDKDLALAAANGDRQAFAALLDRIYDPMFRLAFRLTGSKAEAEDLVQDICAALPAKLCRFRGEAKVMTWLYRIVMNAARDRFRRRASHAKAAEGWGDWEIARRAVEEEQAERADWLRLAMNALTPPELRETLVLILDGLSHAEVAKILGVSEGTISWRISEAKKKLKAMKEAEA
ncbi:ECF RNA polymerase sigma factor SigR [Pelagimonas phthalicica]|uniref:ECF RNA polymerase sigma factor SigR n=1 Tax=Pelagimonas phthalicica TaxID=1037362 RepID=A0A238J7Q8_9RHOB|nr:RNA polymerase sigma factor [Pelagimonas phthalicica]TDS94842.1 RNA polymerase sigma-70 factor (ECF subfamily) [Pelagimonas phthalicica]SMX26629.1 ECF RNA polymerase sigma factor SigR [Pelagimonas phthalicica]